MANPLTGDYEAVVQLAIRQINGLLGTLHQNSATEDTALKVLHGATMRIGDPRRRPPDVDVFGDWVIGYQRASSGRGLHDLRAQLTSAAPPGAARMLADAFVGFDRDWVIQLPPDPPDVVRGRAKLQVATITITVPDGSSSEVTVRAHVRARYYPDPGTSELPAPIHGEVSAGFDVRKVPSSSGTRLLIRPSSQDAKIQFIAAPGTGLSAADENRIAAQVRKFLREGLRLLPVNLPADFPFADFKGLGSGQSQVIALPFQLSGANPPASGVQGLTQSFIGSSGFAFAVSKEYVSGLIDIEAIREAISNRPLVFRLSRWGVTVSVTYRLRFSSGPTLTFKTGGIEISGRVEVETSTWWAPNGFVSFKQLVRLRLDTSAQTVSLERAGEPDVDESWFIPHGTAVNVVKSEIDNALSANAVSIRRIFTDAKSKLVNGMKTFDPFARASYTAVQITPDGVIVRGEIGSIARRAPVADIAETHQGAAFTAFESWIPAGRIDRFIWSWVEHSRLDISILSGTERSFTDEHRFILPKPAGITDISQICLRIEGTQIRPGGQETAIAGGTTCHVREPEVAVDVPSWWEPLTLPIWHPDVADTVALRDAIAGHVSIQANVPGRELLSRNALVYFADWRSARPLEALNAALGRVRNKSALMVIVVLPAGAFDSSRREFESRLPSTGERGRAQVQFTEDDEGGWTRMFAVARTPSVFLINARRELVWKYEGEPDPAVLAAALDQHLVPTPAPQFRPLRLTISPGDSVPDAFFEDDGRNQFALHRLRGRDMLLNFWQSWSAPCLTELCRLQRLHQAGRDAPFIVAFHGGKNIDALDEISKRLGLSFLLVQDSYQRIASRYGVRCWPTTIMVGADGRMEHVQFGTGHGHEPSKPAEPQA
jgi:peroxiredoxin